MPRKLKCSPAKEDLWNLINATQTAYIRVVTVLLSPCRMSLKIHLLTMPRSFLVWCPKLQSMQGRAISIIDKWSSTLSMGSTSRYLHFLWCHKRECILLLLRLNWFNPQQQLRLGSNASLFKFCVFGICLSGVPLINSIVRQPSRMWERFRSRSAVDMDLLLGEGCCCSSGESGE